METLFAEGIGKSYKGRQVVRGVDLKISRGEVVGLLGPNGAGKTTSFYMIVGLVAPETGRVMVDATDITRVPMYLRARNFGISYLPQEPSVFRKLTVEENILAVLEAQPLGNRERRSRTERLIHQLNLGHIRTTRGYALSGGASSPALSSSTNPSAASIPLPCSSCRRSSSTSRPAASAF
jgi:lipopolysaccharide export system ATP-binding protein